MNLDEAHVLVDTHRNRWGELPAAIGRRADEATIAEAARRYTDAELALLDALTKEGP